MKLSFNQIPRLILLSSIIMVVVVLLNWILGYQFTLNSNLLYTFLYTVLYTFSLYYANAWIFQMLDRYFVEEKFSKKRIFIGFLLSFLISVLVIFLLRVFEDVIIEGNAFEAFAAKEKATNYLFAIIITFFVTLSLYAFHFYKAYQENKVKQQKIIAGTASAKFETLKSQIDPHFLFNSLNVLSSLIEENPENAQKFTTSLSKIYRYVLEQKDKELISIEEELSFAKTYMNLLKMRFENSLFYELPDTPINPEAKVVPLSLQLLLENTVKHNVVSEQKPLHIRIFIEGDYLTIQNDLQKKEVLQDREGVGLQNIISRYGIITRRKVLIQSDEKTFTVKIPILTKQVAIMENTANYEANNAYFKAKKRIEELKGFYANLISYCCIIPILIYINLEFSPGFHWFWFSAGGWGFGLTMHAFQVFGYSSKWEARKIQEILNRDQHNNQDWK